MRITAQNSGDEHARIHGFSIAPALGEHASLSQPVAAYILPGQSRSWSLGEIKGNTTPAADWRRLRLKVTTDDGESETELDTAAE